MRKISYKDPRTKRNIIITDFLFPYQARQDERIIQKYLLSKDEILSKKRDIIKEIFIRLYKAFNCLFEYKKDDILYFGTEEDFYGHYFLYDGHLYAADINKPNEFGYNLSYTEGFLGVEIVEFSLHEFKYSDRKANAIFIFDEKTGKVREVLEISDKHRGSFEDTQCKFISECDFRGGDKNKFYYVTEGFRGRL